jgi:hypothetical protein
MKFSDFDLICSNLERGLSVGDDGLIRTNLESLSSYFFGDSAHELNSNNSASKSCMPLPDALLEQMQKHPICTRYLERWRLSSSLLNTKGIKIYPGNDDKWIQDAQFKDLCREFTSHICLPRLSKLNATATTFGSCFARNITEHLVKNNILASTVYHVEDFNNPLVNSLLMKARYKRISEEKDEWQAFGDDGICKYINCIDSYFKHFRPDERYPPRIGKLQEDIKESQIVVFTVGTAFANIYCDKRFPKVDGYPSIAGISFTSSNGESIAPQRRQVLFNSDQIASYLLDIRKSIFRLNPSASFVLSLSPIPLSGMYNKEISYPVSAIEFDCVSKSASRAGIHQFMSMCPYETYYWPAYELVRWISPICGSTLKWQDPRHPHFPSVIDPIMETFVEKVFY